ncbi:VWA domain-containing protein [Streptomyces sp. NPDC053755]|uniref:VWA domain-containing protein n=1 Tax=Streptomyces sp. NPDC053755 TaxID=3155815 RepID=UPI0034186AFB
MTPDGADSVTLPSPTPPDEAAKRAADDLVAAAFDNPKVPQARTSTPARESVPAGTGSAGRGTSSDATEDPADGAAVPAARDGAQAPAEPETTAIEEPLVTDTHGKPSETAEAEAAATTPTADAPSDTEETVASDGTVEAKADAETAVAETAAEEPAEAAAETPAAQEPEASASEAAAEEPAVEAEVQDQAPEQAAEVETPAAEEPAVEAEEADAPAEPEATAEPAAAEQPAVESESAVEAAKETEAVATDESEAPADAEATIADEPAEAAAEVPADEPEDQAPEQAETPADEADDAPAEPEAAAEEPAVADEPAEAEATPETDADADEPQTPAAEEGSLPEPAVAAEAEAETDADAEAAPDAEPVAAAQAAEPAPDAEPVAAAQAETAAADAVPAVALAEVKASAPQLVDAYKAAGAVLKKQGLTGARAAVYLVVDRSGSMRGYFKDGSVQRIAEQTVALAAHLTEDATVTAVFFSTDIDGTAELRPEGIDGRVDEINAGLGRLGRTNYHRAVEEVLAHHEKADPTRPAFVVFQTDGAPESKTAATEALAQAADRPIHWQFVAWGEEDNKAFDYLRKLTAPRTGTFFAGPTPAETAHPAFFRGLLADWQV